MANPMPWITYYAAILKPSIVLLWIVAIAWVYTLINLAQTYATVYRRSQSRIAEL